MALASTDPALNVQQLKEAKKLVMGEQVWAEKILFIDFLPFSRWKFMVFGLFNEEEGL